MRDTINALLTVHKDLVQVWWDLQSPLHDKVHKDLVQVWWDLQSPLHDKVHKDLVQVWWDLQSPLHDKFTAESDGENFFRNFWLILRI